jgi:hypothetical protein
LGAVVAGFFFFATLYTEVLWFDQLGFLQVLFTSWGGTAIMFVLGFLGMFLPVWLSINIAYRFRPVYAKLSSELDRYRQMIDPLRRVARRQRIHDLAQVGRTGRAISPRFRRTTRREPAVRIRPFRHREVRIRPYPPPPGAQDVLGPVEPEVEVGSQIIVDRIVTIRG